MAEQIISPGVFTQENDLSFLPAGIGAIGAAIIGPTVKGPCGVPTLVTSYAEFVEKFGNTFISGSDYYQYLTSHAAERYLQFGGALTVVRLDGDSPSHASSSINSAGSVSGTTFATSSITLGAGLVSASAQELTINGVDFVAVISASLFDQSTTERYYTRKDTVDDMGAQLVLAINDATLAGVDLKVSASYLAASNELQLSGSAVGTTGNVSVTTSSISGNDQAVFQATGTGYTLQSGTDTGAAGSEILKFHTLGDGTIMNSKHVANASVTENGTNNILPSGSKDNLRWEVSATSSTDGTFTVLVRRGDDDINNKIILETWNNCSLDPNATNYVSKVIGDMRDEVDISDSSDPFIKKTGSYPNKSKYIRVEVLTQTVDYLDANGDVREPAASASLPGLGSGSFEGGVNGTRVSHPHKFYENISSTNSQGLNLSTLSTTQGGAKFNVALNLLANQDFYDINMIMAPGINQNAHGPCVDKIIKVCESRGDCIAIVDPVPYGSSITTAVDEANDYNSSYAAMYWPWIQITDNQLGANRWVPASVVMPGIMAYSDEVAAEWYAPAGLNRGGIVAHRAERNLTHSNRDVLYNGRINPIATFPGVGVCAWGQKTLQKRASALDRVNVRRLLINLKKFIASTSKFLVFENNTNATRNKFLATVVPYMESVQANQGLYAFRVVMDTTNNTPDIIDRNIMKGDIFIQPARAAEFIVVDFNIMPTGATFND